MDPIWDGITRGVVLGEGRAVADAAKRYDWPATLDLLRREPGLVNDIRPGGLSLHAPLHQAAHGGAPAEVGEELVRLGTWVPVRSACIFPLVDFPVHTLSARGSEHSFRKPRK